MSLSTFFHSISNFFHSDKAKHDFEVAGKLVETALPIVRVIAALTPNRTDDEILAAFEHFGVPAINNATSDPGAALLALATSVITEKVPAGTAKSIIQLAIQSAVVGMKGDKAA